MNAAEQARAAIRPIVEAQIGADLAARAEVDFAAAALAARWYAHPNDLIGGWCVMPVDQPPSCGVGEVADFTRQEIAEHIAGLHNARLAGIRAIQATGDPADAELPAGATAVVVYGIEDTDGEVHAVLDVRHALEVLPDYGPEAGIVWWTVTTSPPVAYRPAPVVAPCDNELHGADGGRCPGCGWDSHPIPAGPAPAWDHPLATRVMPTDSAVTV